MFGSWGSLRCGSGHLNCLASVCPVHHRLCIRDSRHMEVSRAMGFTRILELAPYPIAILATWGLGVPALTAHCYRVRFASSRVSVAALHCCLTGFIVAF